MKKVVFIGSKEQGFSVLKKLFQLDKNSMRACITFDDQFDSRSYYMNFKNFCEENEIQCIVLKKPREIRQIILELKPDLCFVSGWYFIIEADVIKSVPMGFIGIHNSILPNYRGFAPLVWSMINGEKKAGVSLFDFSEKLDAGKIWASGTVSIEDKDYIGDVLNKISEKILEILDKIYLLILNNELMPYEQPQMTPSYCARRLPEDGLINWNMPAKRVYDFIRAQSHPYPGAYTIYKGKRLTVWRAELFDFTYYGTPGQIGQIFDDKTVLVVCGDSKGIVLCEIDYDGKTESVSNILNSLTIRL